MNLKTKQEQALVEVDTIAVINLEIFQKSFPHILFFFKKRTIHLIRIRLDFLCISEKKKSKGDHFHEYINMQPICTNSHHSFALQRKREHDLI